MMQQPELGKKILELRKTKGLTQQELVEKCNLSVRTLQRIESGKVRPRSITVRLVFEALEFDYDNFLDLKKREKERIDQNWLEQFHISLLDLPNLKSNTMKKVSVLSITFASIIFGLFTILEGGKAQNNKDNSAEKTVNEEQFKQSVGKIKEGNFSCDNFFFDKNEMIGSGVNFRKEGVTVDVNLVKLNTETGEFNAGFIKGYILSNKVEVTPSKSWIEKKELKYSAKDRIEFIDGKIILFGDAKISSTANEFIEADRITIY